MSQRPQNVGSGPTFALLPLVNTRNCLLFRNLTRLMPGSVVYLFTYKLQFRPDGKHCVTKVLTELILGVVIVFIVIL